MTASIDPLLGSIQGPTWRITFL